MSRLFSLRNWAKAVLWLVLLEALIEGYYPARSGFLYPLFFAIAGVWSVCVLSKTGKKP